MDSPQGGPLLTPWNRVRTASDCLIAERGARLTLVILALLLTRILTDSIYATWSSGKSCFRYCTPYHADGLFGHGPIPNHASGLI